MPVSRKHTLPRISLALWKGYIAWKNAELGAVSLFNLALTSLENVEPYAAVSPEMNAQYLNMAYLVLSLHPVDLVCQHSREQGSAAQSSKEAGDMKKR